MLPFHSTAFNLMIEHVASLREEREDSRKRLPEKKMTIAHAVLY